MRKQVDPCPFKMFILLYNILFNEPSLTGFKIYVSTVLDQARVGPIKFERGYFKFLCTISSKKKLKEK